MRAFLARHGVSTAGDWVAVGLLLVWAAVMPVGLWMAGGR